MLLPESPITDTNKHKNCPKSVGNQGYKTSSNIAFMFGQLARHFFENSYTVYVWFFLLPWLVSPQCTDKHSRVKFSSDFPSQCFDLPKLSNFTSSGVQNCKAKNRALGMIVTSFQDFKLREKQISQSFSYCELIKSLRNGTIVHCL